MACCGVDVSRVWSLSVRQRSTYPVLKIWQERSFFWNQPKIFPPHWAVRYLLVGLGERGWFSQLSSVMIGRPKAWDFTQQNTVEQKANYRKDQRETVVSVIREYNETIPIVQNVDFGHTDPQIVLPIGRKATLSPKRNIISLDYS